MKRNLPNIEDRQRANLFLTVFLYGQLAVQLMVAEEKVSFVQMTYRKRRPDA